jgi:hypothetical protein
VRREFHPIHSVFLVGSVLPGGVHHLCQSSINLMRCSISFSLGGVGYGGGLETVMGEMMARGFGRRRDVGNY